MNKHIKELVFVYNADANILAYITDAVHKVVSPETYGCNLCRISYNTFTMKKEWQEFINSLPYRSIFLHRDEFGKKYSGLARNNFPAVFINNEGKLSVLIRAEEINKQKTLEDLKSLIKQKLEF